MDLHDDYALPYLSAICKADICDTVTHLNADAPNLVSLYYSSHTTLSCYISLCLIYNEYKAKEETGCHY